MYKYWEYNTNCSL